MHIQRFTVFGQLQNVSRTAVCCSNVKELRVDWELPSRSCCIVRPFPTSGLENGATSPHYYSVIRVKSSGLFVFVATTTSNYSWTIWRKHTNCDYPERYRDLICNIIFENFSLKRDGTLPHCTPSSVWLSHSDELIKWSTWQFKPWLRRAVKCTRCGLWIMSLGLWQWNHMPVHATTMENTSVSGKA